MSVPFPPGIPRVEGPGLGEECVGVWGELHRRGLSS